MHLVHLPERSAPAAAGQLSVGVHTPSPEELELYFAGSDRRPAPPPARRGSA